MEIEIIVLIVIIAAFLFGILIGTQIEQTLNIKRGKNHSMVLGKAQCLITALSIENRRLKSERDKSRED